MNRINYNVMPKARLNFEVTKINNELKSLEEEIACFGKKSDIDSYFELLSIKKAVTEIIRNK